MATAAGNLVVHLTAKTNQFERGIKTAQRDTTTFRDRVRDATGALGSLHPVLGTAVGMLAGPAGIATGLGAAAFAFKRFASESEAIVSAANRLGMSTEMYERLQHVAERTGSSFEMLGETWQRMQVELSRAAGGSGKADIFEQLGLDARSLSNQPFEETFTRMARAVSSIENPIARARMQAELFGETGPKLDAVLRRVAGGLGDIAVVSSEARTAMSDLENQWLDFRREVATGARETAGGVVVGLGGLRENMREIGALLGGGAEGLRHYISTRDRMGRTGGGNNASSDIEAMREQNKLLSQRTNVIERLQAEIDKMKHGADAVELTAFREMGGDVDLLRDMIQERNRLADAAEREATAAAHMRAEEERRRGILQSLADEADRLWMGDDAFAIRDLEGPQREEAERLQEEIRKMQDAEDRANRGRDLTRSVETPAEALQRRLDEIEQLASSGDIGGETRLRALEQLDKDFAGEEAGPTRFAGAMNRDTREAYSTILASSAYTRDDATKKVAEHTKRSADRLQEMRDFIRELVALQRDAQEVEIPAA